MDEQVLVSLVYIVLIICIVYPPNEFVSAGFTIESLFYKFLGTEHESFIGYHIRRTMLNLLIYSLLPLGYILFVYTTGYTTYLKILAGSQLWSLGFSIILLFPVTTFLYILKMINDDYNSHPIVMNLMKFSNQNTTNWKHIARDIDTEFRRIDKIIIQTNPIIKVVATENWIMKVTPITISLTHQSDAALSVRQTDIHQISLESEDETQFLNIEVKSSRIEPFIIRINARHFRDLQDRIARIIAVPSNIKFYKTTMDKFVDAFKDAIKDNARYQAGMGTDQCIGCLQARPNVKLQKLCENADDNVDDNCTICYCRPMWCVDCMAKWFASRQDGNQQNTWLLSKGTCPLCRAKFCILDVSLLVENED